MTEQSTTSREQPAKIGRYEIQHTLGKGAMGVVYQAHDPMLERDIALKVMVSQIADDPALHERFAREAKAVAKMTHPNVVMVFDLGYHTDGAPYIAMELLKGQDLAKAMRAVPPLPLDRKVAVIVRVLAGLAHAHQAGIVHRDIKPANIFLNQDGGVKIMDFGVARLTTASMTGTGNIIGTADYMSPEQVKGARVDGRSDLFSVGCMLYELVGGRRPFHADNLMAIFYKITHEEPNLSLVPPNPEHQALLPILRKALAKDLDARFQTAYEFAMALKEYLKEHADSATAQHALEGLLEMEPPTHQPQPITDVPRSTVTPTPGSEPTLRGSEPTVLAARRGTPPPGRLQAPAGAVEEENPATYIVTDRPPARPVPAPRPRPAGPPAERKSILPMVGAGGLVAALVAGAGVWLLLRDTTPTVAPSAAPPAPPVSLAVSTPAPPPPSMATPAPPPTFEASGKGAAAIHAAQAAFSAGDYDRAVREAQTALRQDPRSTDARRLLESATNGQAAAARLRTAEAALGGGDAAAAVREAEAARVLAPWDARVAEVLGRARSAQLAEQRQREEEERRRQAAAQATPPPPVATVPPAPPAAQLNALLGQADSALAGQKYDAAIALYDEALKLDPNNARAGQGRAGAIAARAITQAAAAAKAAPRRAFVASKTVASSVQTRAGSLPPGFEESGSVKVGKSQASALPGRIVFDVEPDAVRAGDRYKVRVSLFNEGEAPIQIRDMVVSTKINGRGVQGPVPPMVAAVAPQQKALLRELSDLWKDDTESWTMEVTVRTTRGESYRSSVTWE